MVRRVIDRNHRNHVVVNGDTIGKTTETRLVYTVFCFVCFVFFCYLFCFFRFVFPYNFSNTRYAWT